MSISSLSTFAFELAKSDFGAKLDLLPPVSFLKSAFVA